MATMETDLQKEEKSSISEKLNSRISEFIKSIRKVGVDDPRRIIHSAKVGLALTLVSFFYYSRPLYHVYGQAGMAAIVTVLLVFEFSVGATLSRCMNRAGASLLAGGLAIGAQYLARLCGEKGGPIVLGIMVFSLATMSTFTRFFPNVRRRYDYGALAFIITFSIVAISGYRVTQIIEVAHQRITTILIGTATCIIISIFICPVWAGQDLHNLVASNIQKLAAFLEGFGGELLTLPGEEIMEELRSKSGDKSFLQGYKSVLNSTANEEVLAIFAWWEPGHDRFKFHHPWKQYLKIGALTRECACLIESLNASYIYSNSLTTAATSEFEMKIREACVELSTESGKALKEICLTIKNMRKPSASAVTHIQNARSAAQDLKTMLQNYSPPAKPDLQEIMPILVVASVLVDIINCVDKISESVLELSRKARFKNPKSTEQQPQVLHRGIVIPVDEGSSSGGHVAVQIHEIAADLPEKKTHLRDD